MKWRLTFARREFNLFATMRRKDEPGQHVVSTAGARPSGRCGWCACAKLVRHLLMLLMVTTSISAGTPDSMMISFELKDQFDRSYTPESWGDRVVVLFGSDRGGSSYNPLWAQALIDSLHDAPDLHGLQIAALADLRGVPFFLKAFVRGKFPREKDMAILMDWKGVFPKAYGFVADRSNILVFDRAGRLVYQAAEGDVHEQGMNDLLSVVSPLLRTAPAPPSNTATR